MKKNILHWYTGIALFLSAVATIKWWIGFLGAGSFSIAETQREENVLIIMAILSIFPYLLMIPLYMQTFKNTKILFDFSVGLLATFLLFANLLYQITGVLGFPVSLLVVIVSLFILIFGSLKRRRIKEAT